MDERSVEVASVRWVGERTIAIELQTPDGMVAEPGQFFLIRATVDGEEFARHYTMSSPDADGTFELTVGVDPEGALSPWLATRNPGEQLTVSGPFGTIFYDGEADTSVLAGGPGIGAGLGVAERTVNEGGRTALIALIEGDELPHEERIAALAQTGTPVYLCREESPIQHAVETTMATRPETQWFVFGFRPFAELSRDAIESAGGSSAEAKIESYG